MKELKIGQTVRIDSYFTHRTGVVKAVKLVNGRNLYFMNWGGAFGRDELTLTNRYSVSRTWLAI